MISIYYSHIVHQSYSLHKQEVQLNSLHRLSILYLWLFNNKKKFISRFSNFLGEEFLYDSVCLSVCLYACMYVRLVCLSHFFLNPYILQHIHFTDIVIRYRIFYIKKIRIFCLQIFFKSRLCSYINIDFLQFHYISAKIYILQICPT